MNTVEQSLKRRVEYLEATLERYANENVFLAQRGYQTAIERDLAESVACGFAWDMGAGYVG